MLKNFIALYVPGTFGLEGKLPASRQAELSQITARKLSSEFGGATSHTAQGYYVADDGTLVEEKIIIVKAYHDKDPGAALAIGRKIAQWLKNELCQELVSLETELGLDFI